MKNEYVVEAGERLYGVISSTPMGALAAVLKGGHGSSTMVLNNVGSEDDTKEICLTSARSGVYLAADKTSA